MSGAGLIGRSALLAELDGRLAAGPPLLTLWGPPGVGKSALARVLMDARPAMWSVDLPDRVPEGQIVVLDGLDPARVPEVVAWRARHSASVLVTARGRLRMDEEQAVEIPPLAPDAAAALFCRRAAAAGHAVEGDGRVPALVAAADHLPLAVLVAAERLDLLGFDGVLAALTGDSGALRGPVDGPPHHRSLADALAAEHGRLSASARSLLRGLSVFRGPFGLADVHAVLGPVALADLDALRDRAWLVGAGPGRFSMLGCVRVFAGPASATDAHAAWFARRAAETWRAADDGGASRKWLLDHLADVRAALDHDGVTPRGRETAVALAGVGAPVDLDPFVVAFPDDPALRRARARLRRGAGDLAGAEADLRAAVDGAEGAELGVVWRELGVVLHRARSVNAARDAYSRALALHAQADDARSAALTTGNLGALAHDVGDGDAAIGHYRAALSDLQRLGDGRVEGIFWSNLGTLLAEQGDEAAARDALERALQRLEGADDPRYLAIALGNLGWLCHVEGRPAEAATLHARARTLLEATGDRVSLALCLARSAAAVAAAGDAVAARDLLDAADRCVAPTDDRVARRVVRLCHAFHDLAVGRPAAAAELVRRARAPVQGLVLVEVSDDARTAVALLEAWLQADPGRALCVGPDGTWFRAPGDAQVSLARYANASRMLAALVQARLDTPGRGLDLDALFAAGWPDARIGRSSAHNRVHVALARLRKSGLRQALVRSDQGYLLDPALPVLALGG